MFSTTGVRLGLLLTITGVAQAQAPAEVTFDVEYAAPAECPDEAAFIAAISVRAPSARRVDAGLGEVHLSAQVLADGPSWLSITMPEGSSRREIPAASCDEAVSSMAVIASMVLEASPESRMAMTDAPLARPPSPAETETAPAPAPAEPSASPQPPRPAPNRDVIVQKPRSGSNAVRYGVSVGAAYESAAAPSPTPLAAFGAELAWTRDSFWSPALGAQFLMSPETTETRPDGEASFRLLTGRLNGCPLRFGSESSPRLRPCISLDAGSLRGEGGGAALNQKTVWMTWLAAGLGLRGELDLGRFVTLEASISGRWIPKHDRFIFRPSSLVYDIPPISLGFGLGLSVWP